MDPYKVKIGSHVYNTKGIPDIVDLEAIEYMLKEPNNQVKGIPLSYDFMIKLGFKYQPCGISGSDMWQGMGFWTKDEVVFRGDKRITYPLKIQGYINSQIEFIHELEDIFTYLTNRTLNIT